MAQCRLIECFFLELELRAERDQVQKQWEPNQAVKQFLLPWTLCLLPNVFLGLPCDPFFPLNFPFGLGQADPVSAIFNQRVPTATVNLVHVEDQRAVSRKPSHTCSSGPSTILLWS